MRNLSIDVLKIVLAFFVVFLHMQLFKNSYPLVNYLSVNGLFRLAVPIFLIITGYYFFYVDQISKLRKWLLRTLVLYAIWMIIYIYYWKDEDHILLTILFGYHHLWYLIGTFFSGIVLYFLRNQSTMKLISLAVLLFLTGYAIQILGNLHYFKDDTDSVLNMYFLYRNFLFVCFPFLTVGFLINRQKAKISSVKYGLLLTILAVLCVIAEAYFNYKNIGSESTDILISLLFACPLLFLYFKNKYIKTNSKFLANLSTAIYVVHPLIMKSDFYKNITSFKILIFLVILLPVSFALVYISKKIKYLL